MQLSILKDPAAGFNKLRGNNPKLEATNLDYLHYFTVSCSEKFIFMDVLAAK